MRAGHKGGGANQQAATEQQQHMAEITMATAAGASITAGNRVGGVETLNVLLLKHKEL